jgi:hypothetical protein
MAATAISVANARNVIREWGGHDPNQFFVEISLLNGDDIAVHILANSQPELPWKFEAFNSVTQQPGYINSITIEPGRTLGGIHLSVIGNGNENPPHKHGAAQLKALDLVTNGDGTNVLGTIDLTGNLAANGPIFASGIAGACTVGGSVLHAITVDQDIEATIRITGFVKAALTCGSLHDLTVSGVGSSLFAPPDITINSSYAHHMSVNQTIDTPSLAGDVDPNANIQIAGYSSPYNLAMPTGVLYGTVKVGDSPYYVETGSAGTEPGELRLSGRYGARPLRGWRQRTKKPRLAPRFRVDQAGGRFAVKSG